MKKITILILTLLAFIIPLSASALTLDEAKAQGLLGETLSGYLEIVNPPGTIDSQNLKNEINQKRKAKYQEIAKKRGSSLLVVEQLAGKQAIEKTPSGQFVQLENKQWVRK